MKGQNEIKREIQGTNPGFSTQTGLNVKYSDLLKSELWLKKRNLILIRDGHRCLNCGSHHNLQVHHRQYHTFSKTNNFKYPWQYKDKYLVTLCFDCHQAGHKYFKIPVFNV